VSFISGDDACLPSGIKEHKMDEQTKGNILVIGNSGVGKSTLINAVLGEKAAYTAWGGDMGTYELHRYEGKNLPFDLIDTIGFSPENERKTIKEIRSWLKKEYMGKTVSDGINVVWFCVDGTSGKLFANTLECFAKSVSDWKSIPVIIVITKSYSVPDREQNIRMIHDILSRQKKLKLNVQKVIPVVSEPFFITESTFAPAEGITELIEYTNALMPEGKKAASEDIGRHIRKKRSMQAQALVGGYVAAAVAVAAVPIPFPDHFLLIPLETAMINGIANHYGVKKNSGYEQALKYLLELGAVTAAAKAALEALKAVPGLTLGAVTINAIVAGSIVAGLGEACIGIFELVSKGEKTLEDSNFGWIKDMVEQNISVKKILQIAEKINITKKKGNKDIADEINSEFQ
jgi:predicted GTPase